jgi:peptidoglycan/LPS O-acetylase OafA/YrhL
LLSFAAGALIWFLRRRGAFNVDARFGVIALVAWIANMVAAGSLLPESYVYGASYYVGTLAFAYVVVGLADHKPGALMARLDHALGEIAYPLFLVQWLAGFIVALAFFPGNWRGWSLMLATTPVMIGLSVGLAKLSRMTIEPLRDRIRARAVREAPFTQREGAPERLPAGLPN